MSAPKIVQLVPALPGWFIRDVTERYMLGVACWALMDDGTVAPVVPGDSGVSAETESCTVYEPHQAYEYRCTDGHAPTNEDWEPALSSERYILWRKPHGFE
jgi:hypothetical protein